jgi:hypothetical protein
MGKQHSLADAAAYLTERGVPSISPEMGTFLVRAADEVTKARKALPSLSPLVKPLFEYEQALNTIAIMACLQQVSVIGVLQAALKRSGL